MTSSTPDRPSDTEAAHAPTGHTPPEEGRPHIDQNFARNIEGRERRDPGGQPTRLANSAATAGGEVADALPEEAVMERAEDLGLQTFKDPR